MQSLFLKFFAYRNNFIIIFFVDKNIYLLYYVHMNRYSHVQIGFQEVIMALHDVEHCDCHETHKDLIEKVTNHMPDEDELYDLAELFKVFGDSTRIRMLSVLMRDEMCVCDLAEVLSMNQSAISHQLKILKQAKLVKNRREGKQVYYSLSDNHVSTILAMGLEHIEEK